MNMLIENGEEMTLTDEQREYLAGMGYIYDSGDGHYHTFEDTTLDEIEKILMKAGLTA